MSPLELTAQQILAIPPSRPDKLFGSGDVDQLVKQFAKKWHPDLNPDPRASDVLAQITLLAANYHRHKQNGTLPGFVTIRTSGKELNFPILAERVISSGKLYISDHHIVQAFSPGDTDLATQALNVTKRFRYPSEIELKKTLSVGLPQDVHVFRSTDVTYLVMKKTGEFIRLTDLPAKLDLPHVAWVGSRMFNYASWLRFNDIRHYGITAESFYIEAKTHFGGLLGGWEFSGTTTLPPKAADPKVLSNIPGLKTADADSAHSSQIRTILRNLLGHRTTIQLRQDTSVPKAMSDFLTTPPRSNAFEEYEEWYRCLEQSFGKRRFTVLNMKSPYV